MYVVPGIACGMTDMLCPFSTYLSCEKNVYGNIHYFELWAALGSKTEQRNVLSQLSDVI